MNINKFILVFIASCISSVAFADTFVGIPKGAHYNGAVAGRGICVQLASPGPDPDPSGSDWFCNYNAGNSTYNEINTTLMEASFRKTKCDIASTALGPDGHHKIEWVSCPSFIPTP